jgi:NAD(P)-dependent dehydrogenase (short-subunit alcohol dehydrogenase family)
MDTVTAKNETVQNPETTDPAGAGPQPTFPQRKQPYPGSDSQMTPKADHGEESYRGLGRLEGRCALITGGDSGIGRAVAIAYAREGADVAIAYLPEEEEDAAETAAWVTKAGRKVVKLPADVREEGVCGSLVERTFAELGDLDILVNNAAFQATHDAIAEFTTEEFDRTFKTNVYATFWLSKAALGRMKNGSVIINTASIQAFDPSPNLLAYAATKAAIANLSKSLSKLALKQGVRVNAVAPGPVWTPLIPATMPEEKVKEFGTKTAFGRPAQPVEIAPIFVFLASNESRFVSGEVYGATGSQTPL